MSWLKEVIGTEKAVIAMCLYVHCPATRVLMRSWG